ncbi:DUF1129 family protein [Bacillaceae bacterium W0354]
MDANSLIKENNEKRKQLSKENLKWYEDMLVYIRLSFDKSEQETEEVLTEILDHLLEAQADGKTAQDVYGHYPKMYANEILGELPKMITKKRMMFLFMIIFYFLAAAALGSFLFDLISFYIFKAGEIIKTYYLGTEIVILVLSISFAFLFLYIVIQFLRWTCFRNLNNVLEFFLLWILGVLSFGVFFLIRFFMPDFGPTIEISSYIFLGMSVILYIVGRFISRKIG